MKNELTEDEIIKIAQVCHEANRAYCHTIGDDTQLSWDYSPDWQKASAINGVKFHIEHEDSKPSDSHENWRFEKLKDGWKYGPVKDAIKKEHPCLVPYESLPITQRVKDALFLSIVRALTGKV